jgi:Protein of unknown function (DUF2795)
MVASTSRDEVRRCLADVDFPAGKDRLVNAALEMNCEETARALRAIPPETYSNLGEVLASVTHDDDGLSDSDKAAARRTHTRPGLAENAKDLGPVNPIVEELGENRYS